MKNTTCHLYEKLSATEMLLYKMVTLLILSFPKSKLDEI